MTRLFVLSVLSISLLGAAPRKAVTETGEEVLLHSDGRWTSLSGASSSELPPLGTNRTFWIRPDASSFPVKSLRTPFRFRIDPKRWSFKKDGDDGVVEYRFELRKGDGYAMAITEGLETDLENLERVAIANAKKASSEFALVKREIRRVNGLPVLHLEMKCTVDGLPFHYLGYYAASPKGCVQLLAYFPAKRLAEFRDEMFDFLNGLEGS